MIRHTVLFKVKPSVSQGAIDNAFKLLFELKHSLSGIISIAGGKCHYHQNKLNNFITHGFSIDFDTQEAYENFLNNPITHPAKGCLINIIVDGYDGLFGFDMGRKPLESFPNPLDKYRAPTPRLLPPGSITR